LRCSAGEPSAAVAEGVTREVPERDYEAYAEMAEAKVAAIARGEAFTGARALIDRVKAEAPIWKVEVDGADHRRVEGTLPPV